MATAEARQLELQSRAFMIGGARAGNNMASQNGLRAENFPNAKREGLASILDRSIRRGDVVKNREALGEGAVTMKFYDETGAAIEGPEASLNIHDIIFTADASGSFRLVDEAYLQEKTRLEKQKRKYIDKVCELMATDEVFIKTLGISAATFDEIARPGESGGLEFGMPMGLKEADARPSICENYVGGSQLYMLAIAKQRFIIRKFMPILQSKAETNTGDLDAKDAFTSATNADAAPMAGTSALP